MSFIVTAGKVSEFHLLKTSGCNSANPSKNKVSENTETSGYIPEKRAA